MLFMKFYINIECIEQHLFNYYSFLVDYDPIDIRVRNCIMCWILTYTLISCCMNLR